MTPEPKQDKQLEEAKRNELYISKDMTARELIDIISPNHDRTSCNDKDLNNGFYSNDSFTRCMRCTLLEIIEKGYLPKSHFLMSTFAIDDKKAKEELENESNKPKKT